MSPKPSLLSAQYALQQTPLPSLPANPLAAIQPLPPWPTEGPFDGLPFMNLDEIMLKIMSQSSFTQLILLSSLSCSRLATGQMLFI